MPFIEALGQFSYHVGKLICSGPLFYRLINGDFSFIWFHRTKLLLSCCLFLGPGNFCLIHVSLVPVLNVVGEQVLIKFSLP